MYLTKLTASNAHHLTVFFLQSLVQTSSETYHCRNRPNLNSTLPPSNMHHRRSRPSPGPSGTIPRRRPLRGAAAQPARPPELATQEGRYRLRPRHPHRHTDLAPCCGGTLVSAALRRRQPVPPYLSPSCVSNNIKWLMNYLTAHDVSTCSACRAHVPLNHPIGDTGAVLGPGHPACLRIGAARMSGRSASHGPRPPHRDQTVDQRVGTFPRVGSSQGSCLACRFASVTYRAGYTHTHILSHKAL